MTTGLSHILPDLTQALRAERELTSPEVAAAASALLEEGGNAADKADFLRSLSAKGESVAEITGFVEAFLERAVDPGLDAAALSGPLIDVCGTGGDRLDLFNVSTACMFVLAAGGATVVKHGNRSITSQCGGADVLEALGIPIDLPAADLREQVKRHGLGFLFAPHYHPAFKVIGPIRKTLAAEGTPTLFNLLGPLLNPARPTHHLVGLYTRPAMEKYAQVLQKLGRTRAWVVHGMVADSADSAVGGVGMDEISSLGHTYVQSVTPETIESAGITVAQLRDLGLCKPTLEELRGGGRDENAEILLGIFENRLHGPKRELVELNAGAAFVVAGLAPDLASGLALAREQISTGRALAKLHALRR